MFKELCGGETLKNVVLVTNTWERVGSSVGDDRELELKTKDIHYKGALEWGIRMRPHDNTRESALKAIQEIIDSPPEAVRLQEGSSIAGAKGDPSEVHPEQSYESLDRDVVQMDDNVDQSDAATILCVVLYQRAFHL